MQFVIKEKTQNYDTGEWIKRIHTFQGLRQRELGFKLGYGERNAGVRVAQYESGYHVPKKDTLIEIAKILNVNYINFITETFGCARDIILHSFGLMKMTVAPSTYSSLSAIPASAILLMTNRCVTMI